MAVQYRFIFGPEGVWFSKVGVAKWLCTYRFIFDSHWNGCGLVAEKEKTA